MGKKNKKKSGAKKPFVSVCTPTFNRRPFISHMIKCFEHQDYPKDRMEWIIIDDGTDKIGDLVQHIPQVKYFSYDKKMVLGKKRNLLHEKSCGEIIVYMDDDDYYPPERVSHSVETLLANPKAMCAGASEIYIYFKHIKKLYQFGPYGPNHATAGTFAFRRKMLEDSSYEDTAALAEEKSFLKNYTVPFVQMDPLKTILVFSHEHNTFDKRKLLENPHPDFVRESDKTVEMFVKDAAMRDFYMNVEKLLVTYEPGRPSMKPDVLKQIIEIEEMRRKDAEAMAQRLAAEKNMTVVVQQGDGPPQRLTVEQIVQILRQQQEAINNLTQKLRGKDIEIEILSAQVLQSRVSKIDQDAHKTTIISEINLEN